MMMWIWLMACTTPFSNSESSGVWVQSDFKFNLNRDCELNTVLTDNLQLSYQFGDGNAAYDTGYWGYSLDPDVIGSYKDTLWDYCNRDDQDLPSFSCPMPLFFAHYSTWKEDFYLEQVAAERGCRVDFFQAYEEGLFIDQQTVRLVSQFYAACVDETDDSSVEVALCAGEVSSKLTNVESQP